MKAILFAIIFGVIITSFNMISAEKSETEKKIDKLVERLDQDDILIDSVAQEKIIVESGITDEETAPRILMEQYFEKYSEYKKRDRIGRILLSITKAKPDHVADTIFQMLKTGIEPWKKNQLCNVLRFCKTHRVYNYLYKQLNDERKIDSLQSVSDGAFSVLCNMSGFELPKRTSE